MSRITSEANPLGTFNYGYVDDVSGSSKGTTRLASVNYPNGQVTNFSWYGNIGDQRLESINNVLPSGAPLSQFSYGYDSAGEIVRWGQQQSPSLSPRIQALGYDAASQLTSSQSGFGAAPPKYADQFYYSYDPAANRTAVQSSLTQTATINGTVTSGNVLTIVVSDPALSGGNETVNYTVQAGDTLPSIATNMAAAITADTNLQSLGVNAAASSNQINIRSTSANLTTYSASTSGGATEAIVVGVSTNAVQNATIGGAVTPGNVLTLQVNDQGLSGGSASVSYTATSMDTLNSIASQLASAVNGSSALSAAGITATATLNVVHIKSTSSNLTTYSQSLSSGATETIYLALNTNGPETFLLGGSKTTGNVLGITTYDQNLSGASESISYTVQSTDTLTTIAAALTSAINSDTNLQNIGVSASSSGQLITVTSLSTGVTTYRASRPATATETIVQGLNPNGIETAAIGGTKHNNDVLTITVFDAGLAGGSKAKSYTVHAADTLATIASSLANKIASDSDLSALGITATAASTVVNVSSTSNNLTTYTSSLSAGATETITLGTSTGITGYAYNNLNELTSTSGGGLARFQGTTDKPIKSATINSSVSASLPSSTSFSANANLSAGSNAATVNAIDGNNNSLTNTYQLSVKGGPTATLTFDANGNMTADGSGNSYSWDAENRLIKITYPGSGNYSQFAYDGLGRNVLIQEYTASSLTGTRQFVWTENNYRKEARDASSTITGQYFTLGETISSMGYCFTADHVANPTDLASRFDQLRGGMGVIFSPLFTSSIREMINSSGTVEAQLAYDMYGRATQLQGSLSPDFQFGDYYFHSRSGLSLTLTRAYSSAQGRFINRDAIAERDGLNLYEYVHNHPEQGVDPSGTCVVAVPVVVVAGPEAAVAAGALGAAAIAQAAVLGNTIGGIVNNAMNSGSGGFGGSGATNPWEWNPAHVCPAKPPQDPCDPPVFQPGMTLSKCLMYCTGCSGWKRAGCDIKCRTFLWGN